MTLRSHYIRSLSPFERMWIAAQTSCGFALLEGKGKLSAAALRLAIAAAAAVHPGCRLVLRGHGPWAHWEEVDTLPTVEEVDGSDWDGCDGETAPFTDQAHRDVRQAPSVSYVLLHGETTRLIQRSHHATMDGLGALEFMRDVFRALRGEPLLGADGRETDLELAHKLGARPRQITNDCLHPFATQGSQVAGSNWARLHIPNASGKQLLPRTLIAIASLARRHGNGKVLIDLPVNLRTHFPEIRNTGNLTGSLRLDIDANATTDEISAEIKRQLREQRQADAIVSAASTRFIPLCLIRYIAAAQARRAVKTSNFSPTAIVSNLGSFDSVAYSTHDFKAARAFIVPPAYDGVPLFLVLSGNQDGIDLAARAPQSLGAQGRLKALLAEIATAIEAPA